MSILLAIALAQSAPLPAAVQRLADYNILAGSCEKHIPLPIKAELARLDLQASPKMRAAIEEWREEGRLLARDKPWYTKTVCARLFEAVGTY